jgi:hypothetical protein
MNTFGLLMIVGWLPLLISWMVPKFVKDEVDKAFICGSLSAFSVGVFVANGIIVMME